MPPLAPRSTFWGWFAVAGSCVAAAAGVAFYFRPAPVSAPAPSHIVATAPAAPAASAPAATPAPVPTTSASPSFDVVRVTPEGQAVIAGRAAPGTTVTVREGQREIGTAQASTDGTWVLTPSAPLPPGTGTLTVAGPDGKQSEQQVVLAVPSPSPQTQPATPLAVLTTPAAPPRILQIPGSGHGDKLALQVLDYGETGDVRLAGRAPPKATIRAYVDNAHAGDAPVSKDGAWNLTPSIPIKPGRHMLRLDQLGPTGKVIARIELPFGREAEPGRTLASADSVIVQPGQSLWRIARGTYGKGIRYTVIYAANHDDITDPNRIYPGQIFAVPALPSP